VVSILSKTVYSQETPQITDHLVYHRSSEDTNYHVRGIKLCFGVMSSFV